ncbi:Cross-pathway control protein 1 [Ceratocystis fimbriata CBS 114723]|uniref:Cross-pathway control protein 1 n=1 Tax=Ceratocystis fimbriata CBS 114723 TaxID=1035309 RepID=A0A2C5WW80_9PEZI|nr:Cross-pathway control protein 1 [Ceratocystis fimbriata CBS 114723]
MDFSGVDLNELAMLDGPFGSVSEVSHGLPIVGTVSPQDLVLSDNFSAPGSSSLSTITTPSLYDGSPTFDVSSNFGTSDFDACGTNWFPLFPQETVPAKDSILEGVNSSVCLALSSPSVGSSDILPMSPVASNEHTMTPLRRKGSTTASTRHSAAAGVNAHRRTKPLPPIVVEDPSDTIAMKRARNTLAARKSRERKAQRLEDLEERIVELEKDRDHWKQLYLALCTSQAHVP